MPFFARFAKKVSKRNDVAGLFIILHHCWFSFIKKIKRAVVADEWVKSYTVLSSLSWSSSTSSSSSSSSTAAGPSGMSYITYTNGEGHYQNTVMLLLSTRSYIRGQLLYIYMNVQYTCIHVTASVCVLKRNFDILNEYYKFSCRRSKSNLRL